MTIAMRHVVKFPANVQATKGVDVTRANGTYTFKLNYENLTPAATVASNVNVAFQDPATGAMGVTTLASALNSNANIQAIANTETGIDKLGYWNGTSAYALTDFPAYARGLVSSNSASAARVSLGTVIGTDVQAHSASLDGFAGKTVPNGAVVGSSDTQTLTNKTIDGDSNTLTNVPSSAVTGLSTVATSGAYGDLSGLPTLGDLAAKDQAAIADIAATGTPSSSTYLRGDGAWNTPAGGGDMVATTYDPDNVGADAFDSANTKFLQAGTGAVARPALMKMRDIISARDFGVTGDGTTDDSTAMNAALSELDDIGGGALFLPIPEVAYRIASTLVITPNVSLKGDHGFSSILADDCDAIYLNGVTGFGNITIRDLTIRHVIRLRGALALSSQGPSTSTDAILYGITLRNLMIDGADVPISLLTAQNVVINNIYGQNVGAGIAVNGRTYVVFISDCKFTKTSAVGSSAFGTGFGFDAQAFTYTDLGETRPEGIQISNSQFFGFDTGIRAVRAGTLFMKGVDIDAAVNGVDIGYVDSGCVLRDSVVIIRGSGANYGFVGRGRATPGNGTVLIDGTTFLGAELTGNNAFGIVVNDTGSNQNNVTVSNNTLIDFSGYDILANNPGNVKLVRNTTIQTGALVSPASSSIVMGTRTTGVNLIDGNDCARGIGIVTADDITNGYLVKRDNAVAGDPA